LEVVFLRSVTVLITVRNTSHLIKKCIDSILSLDYPKSKYKIFVVDAFSTDGTWEILKTYGKRIKLKRLKGNAPTAYNYAVRMINTDLIAFTNADCAVNNKWLKEITKPFDNEKVQAVAGFTSNPPKPETKLQEIIGIELEDRYNNFPKKILRAPDMNLCVRTKILKKIKLDENLDVGYDTDFGYKLNKIGGLGSIVYQPKAVIYHYHRATWKAYFKQQYRYAKAVPTLYLKKHKTKIVGDNISKSYMPVQIALLYLIFLFGLTLLISSRIALFFYASAFILLLSYLAHALRLSKSFEDLVWFLFLFFIRNVAWNIGVIVGILNLLR